MRVLTAMFVASLMSGPASSQTNSGGGTRQLGSEAGLKGKVLDGRPIQDPVDIGIGTAVKPALKSKDITSSTIGGGSIGGGSGQGGGAVVAIAPARPPQPLTVCPGSKAWAFSDALNAWYCL